MKTQGNRGKLLLHFDIIKILSMNVASTCFQFRTWEKIDKKLFLILILYFLWDKQWNFWNTENIY